MGINLNKIAISRPDMLCPNGFKDLTQAGSIYVVVHKSKEEGTVCETEQIGHYGVAIDISGSSTEHEFIATHFDLYVVSSTDHTTYLDSTFKIRTWSCYSLARKVGQMPLSDIQVYPKPNRFAQEIQYKLISEVHDIMCALNKSDTWSSMLNCQTFTRRCVEYFGFEFPSYIKIISDCMPTMMNLSLNSSLLTNKAKEISNETISL